MPPTVIIACLISLHLLNFLYKGGGIKSLNLMLDPKKVTPLNSLYYIKITREYFQSKFIFGDIDLAKWDFDLAKKRLDEALILKSSGSSKPAKAQVSTALKYQAKGVSLLNQLIDKTDTNFLIQERDDNKKLLDSFK